MRIYVERKNGKDCGRKWILRGHVFCLVSVLIMILPSVISYDFLTGKSYLYVISTHVLKSTFNFPPEKILTSISVLIAMTMERETKSPKKIAVVLPVNSSVYGHYSVLIEQSRVKILCLVSEAAPFSRQH
jgi:hypothetical protein